MWYSVIGGLRYSWRCSSFISRKGSRYKIKTTLLIKLFCEVFGQCKKRILNSDATKVKSLIWNELQSNYSQNFRLRFEFLWSAYCKNGITEIHWIFGLLFSVIWILLHVTQRFSSCIVVTAKRTNESMATATWTTQLSRLMPFRNYLSEAINPGLAPTGRTIFFRSVHRFDMSFENSSILPSTNKIYCWLLLSVLCNCSANRKSIYRLRVWLKEPVRKYLKIGIYHEMSRCLLKIKQYLAMKRT